MAARIRRNPRSQPEETQDGLNAERMTGNEQKESSMSSNTEDVKNINTPTSEPAAEAAAESTPVQSPGDAARARASQFMAEGRYVDARKALEEAERLEAEP